LQPFLFSLLSNFFSLHSRKHPLPYGARGWRGIRYPGLHPGLIHLLPFGGARGKKYVIRHKHGARVRLYAFILCPCHYIINQLKNDLYNCTKGAI
jgi:hypothetical protein